MVATANPASDQNPSRNRQHISESGWDCGASPQWLGAHAPKPANEVITDSTVIPCPSACEPHPEAIDLGLIRGRNARATWQDLVSEYGFASS